MQYKNITYDMECAIELLTACNYHCEFCSGPRMAKSIRRGFTNQDIQKVIDFFNNSNKTWLIGMSGGEPSIHPHFFNLINSLKEKHYFYFFSNLTFDINKFIQTVSPKRVQYFKASLHKEADENEFLEKFDLLHKKGYNPILIMVSTPDTFDQIERISKISKERGYSFNLSTLEGPYKGKNYPNDYNKQQESFIEEHIEEPGNLIRLFNKTPGGLNTYGCSCRAGKTSFTLDMETGNFTICESNNTIIGNIYENTFNPNNNNIVCKIINGCIGYNRNIYLPDNYINFFHLDNKYISLKNIKDDYIYPKNLDLILGADNDLSSIQKDKAIDAILKYILNKKVLFWGAGIHGAKLLYSIKCRQNFKQVDFLGFIDSLRDRQKLSVLGYNVYSPKDIVNIKYDIIIITSHAFENDIWKKAKNMNLNILRLYKDILNSLGIYSSIF